MLKDQILEIKKAFFEEIGRIENAGELFALEKKYLGRKSQFNRILKNLGALPPEEKKLIGELANAVKADFSRTLKDKTAELEAKNLNEEKEKIDVTFPGKRIGIGHLNPITLVRRDIESIFSQMGYEIADGPEVENEFFNFDALNIPSDHPARDMQDTFWIKSEIRNPKSEIKSRGERLSMRSQTSAVQARYMKGHQPPFRIIVPGKCFRNEATDATHEHTFYQFEALVAGDDINVGHLKHAAEEFFSQFFHQEVKVRLRPSYFPFTEPSFEFDITCTMCGGVGCKSCRGGGWLELGGAGMVNQNVFVAAGYPRGRYTGFAWGFGLERLAMMKYKIDDLRFFHSGDLRFVHQFIG